MYKRTAYLIFGIALAFCACVFGAHYLAPMAFFDGPSIGLPLVMANFTILGRMSFADAPVSNHPVLQPLAIAYRNPMLIFRDVLPEVMVDFESYKYWAYDRDEPYTIPDTRVGRRGEVNEIEFGGKLVDGSTKDFGLKARVPRKDERAAQSQNSAASPLAYATEGVMNLIELEREKECADIVFKAASYNATNKATLAGGTQWSHADGDPLAAIEDAKDTMLYEPNTLVLGMTTWRQVRRNRAVISAINRTDGEKGIASRREFAELLEIENLVIGSARVNTAIPGQTAALSFGWGKHAALLHINRATNPTMGATAMPTFGWTAMWGPRIVRSWMENDNGLEGGDILLAGERRGVHIVDKDLGYFFENAVK